MLFLLLLPGLIWALSFGIISVPWADRLQSSSKDRDLWPLKATPSQKYTSLSDEWKWLTCLVNISRFLRKSVELSIEASINLWWWLQTQESVEISYITMVWREECVSNRTWSGHCSVINKANSQLKFKIQSILQTLGKWKWSC